MRFLDKIYDIIMKDGENHGDWCGLPLISDMAVQTNESIYGSKIAYTTDADIAYSGIEQLYYAILDKTKDEELAQRVVRRVVARSHEINTGKKVSLLKNGMKKFKLIENNEIKFWMPKLKMGDKKLEKLYPEISKANKTGTKCCYVPVFNSSGLLDASGAKYTDVKLKPATISELENFLIQSSEAKSNLDNVRILELVKLFTLLSNYNDNKNGPDQMTEFTIYSILGDLYDINFINKSAVNKTPKEKLEKPTAEEIKYIENSNKEIGDVLKIYLKSGTGFKFDGRAIEIEKENIEQIEK